MTTYVSTTFAYGNVNVLQTGNTLRARSTHIHDAILGAGLVQTSDTGQADVTTFGPAGTGTVGANTLYGYTIYRFADSLQGTDPIFVRVEWRTGSSQSITFLRITTGSGTNGAGVLTGQVSSAVDTSATNATATTISGQTYACHTEGFFGIQVCPNNAYGPPPHAFTISRSRNSSGSFDAKAVIVYAQGDFGTIGGITCARRAATAFSGSWSGHYCIVPGIPGDTALVNGDKQLYPHFYADPAVQTLWSQFTIRGSEFVSAPTSFTAAPVNSVSRTFVSMGATGSPIANVGSNGSFRLAMLWE